MVMVTRTRVVCGVRLFRRCSRICLVDSVPTYKIDQTSVDSDEDEDKGYMWSQIGQTVFPHNPPIREIGFSASPQKVTLFQPIYPLSQFPLSLSQLPLPFFAISTFTFTISILLLSICRSLYFKFVAIRVLHTFQLIVLYIFSSLLFILLVY